MIQAKNEKSHGLDSFAAIVFTQLCAAEALGAPGLGFQLHKALHSVNTASELGGHCGQHPRRVLKVGDL